MKAILLSSVLAFFTVQFVISLPINKDISLDEIEVLESDGEPAKPSNLFSSPLGKEALGDLDLKKRDYAFMPVKRSTRSLKSKDRLASGTGKPDEMILLSSTKSFSTTTTAPPTVQEGAIDSTASATETESPSASETRVALNTELISQEASTETSFSPLITTENPCDIETISEPLLIAKREVPTSSEILCGGFHYHGR